MTVRNGPVAVALLNWNGWRDTITCLESLSGLRYGDVSFILCDNASSDESVDRIVQWARDRSVECRLVEHERDGAEAAALTRRDPSLLIVRSRENRGFAGGTNIAMRYALASQTPYRYIWVLNTDTTVDGDALRIAVRALERRPDAASAQSLLVVAQDPALLDSAGLRLLRRGGAQDMLHLRPRTELAPLVAGHDEVEVFGCCAAAALYRTDVLRSLGLFDESLFQTHEDVDLACRFRAHGHSAILVPGSIVHHVGGVSRDRQKTGWMWWIAHRNKLRIVARWYPRLVALPIVLVGAGRALLGALHHREVSISMWTALLGTLWRESSRGAPASVRRRVFRLGITRLIV